VAAPPQLLFGTCDIPVKIEIFCVVHCEFACLAIWVSDTCIPIG